MVKIQTHGGPGGKTSLSVGSPLLPKLGKKRGHAKQAQQAPNLAKVFEAVTRHLGKGIRDLGGSQGPFGGHTIPRGSGYGFVGNPCGHGGPSIPSDGVSIKNGRYLGAIGFRQWNPNHGWNGFPSVFPGLANLIRSRGA